MAESLLRAKFIVACLLSLIVSQSNASDLSSSTIELNIEIAEELAVGTKVADLAVDAGLDSGHDALQFDLISGSFYHYFSIGGDATQHLLIVDRLIDRELICYHRSACTASIIITFFVHFL